jgi:hypothetical protein
MLSRVQRNTGQGNDGAFFKRSVIVPASTELNLAVATDGGEVVGSRRWRKSCAHDARCPIENHRRSNLPKAAGCAYIMAFSIRS